MIGRSGGWARRHVEGCQVYVSGGVNMGGSGGCLRGDIKASVSGGVMIGGSGGCTSILTMSQKMILAVVDTARRFPKRCREG